MINSFLASLPDDLIIGEDHVQGRSQGGGGFLGSEEPPQSKKGPPKVNWNV